MYKIHDYRKISKRMNAIKKVICILVYIVIIPLLIINFTLVIKSFLSPNEIPDFFGYKNFIIVSESMEPTIMVGDAIFVKNVGEDEIKRNDIISFNDGEDIVSHRVVEIYEENNMKFFKTKGDNNKNEDKQMIKYNQIEGKYQFKIKGFGIVVLFLKSKMTLGILLILVIFNIYFNHNLKIKQKIRNEKRKIFDSTSN